MLAFWLRIARIDIHGCLEILGMNSLGMLDYESQHGVNLGFQCHSCLAKPVFLCLLCFSTSLGVGNYMLKADIKVCSQRFQASWLCAVLNHQLFVEVVHLTCTNNKDQHGAKQFFFTHRSCVTLKLQLHLRGDGDLMIQWRKVSEAWFAHALGHPQLQVRGWCVTFKTCLTALLCISESLGRNAI